MKSLVSLIDPGSISSTNFPSKVLNLDSDFDDT